MNWEESRALTPLKRDFLKAFFASNQGFFLTGGSALGIFYLQHRLSFDLDFFTTLDSMDWHVLDNEVRSVSRTISAECNSITTSPTFRRYQLIRGGDREILDFVIELTPQMDPEKERFGTVRVDTLREIMVNKICTLIGRCEIKDLVDLYFLDRRGLSVSDHFEAARQKEGGLDPAMISYILSHLQIDQVPDYVFQEITLEELRSFAGNLQRWFAETSFPEQG